MDSLDDISKTSFCIPYSPPLDGDDARHSRPNCLPPSSFSERDLKDGSELRFRAYRRAWKKCLDRMQEIVHNLQRSTVRNVVKEVKTAYTAIHPGLPNPELPVISVISSAFGSSLVDKIANALEDDEDDDAMENAVHNPCFAIHLHPEDFVSTLSGMKAIVSGFIDKDNSSDRARRKATTSLASYDIYHLDAWYKSRMASKDSRSLVAFIHDFEQCDRFVMQDIFHVCSRACSQLPLVFILLMSSPVPNHLHLTYRASTLSLLRLQTVIFPSGIHILQEIWLKTFVDVEFNPDIVVGHKVVEFLTDYFTRHSSSIDIILTVLQIAHLKHFSLDPITVFVHETPSTILEHREAAALLNPLGARIAAAATVATGQEDNLADFSKPTAIAAAVDAAREKFHARATDMRLGFGIMLRVQTELRKHGHRGLAWSPDIDKDEGLCDAMINLLRGHLVRDVKLLRTLSKKLKTPELRSILDSILYYFFNMPSHVRTQEQEARSDLILLGSQIAKPDDVEDESSNTEHALKFSDWITNYLCDKLGVLEENALWDIWYTGLSPPTTEVLNPSVRASVVAGLLKPYEYANDPYNKVVSGSPDKALWQLPDTSILFKRYLDSGKMINVYDWFESFKTVLDAQRLPLTETAAMPTSSPRKRGRNKSAKAKGKSRAKMTEEEEEKWKVEVQARFIRALHELDYLGFIKHTGRKADHVVRTVFEVDDAQDE